MPAIELNATQSSAMSGMTPTPAPYTPLAAVQGYGQWLSSLRQILPADHLVLFRCHGKDQHRVLSPLASWPESKAPGKKLEKLAERCMQSGSVVWAKDRDTVTNSAVCFPDRAVRALQQPQLVLLLQRPSAANQDLKSDAKLVSWALRSLDRFVPDQTTATRYPQLVQWLSDCHPSTRADDTSNKQSQLMEHLVQASSSSSCQLASLTLKRGKVAKVKLLALSGYPKVDSRLAAAREKVVGIEQCYLHARAPLQVKAEPVLPAGDGHARLIIPVMCEEKGYAVCMDRRADKPFSVAEQKHLTAAATLSVSMLHFIDASNLSLFAACRRYLYRLRTWIVAAVPRSALLVVGVSIVLTYLLFPVEHRISAPLSVEAAQRHVLIAPADGFVESVTAKAGDTVSKGQVLATLEDLELQLQQQKLRSEQLHNQQAFAEALAVHDRVNVTRLKEEGSLIEKELAQLAIRAQRMMLTSPVDAVVLDGSWDDFLGAAVKAGDTLYSLGSTDAHKLVLDVSEYDIKSVQAGQPVDIRLSADPSQVYPGVVTAIMPLAVTRPSGNSVQVHATLDEVVRLLPGMQGLGKIQVGRSSRLEQWLKRAGSRLLWLGWRSGLIK